MNKYQEGIFYIANLIKLENGEVKPYKENKYFTYDEENDKFTSFEDTLNPYLDLLSPNLNTEERKEIKELIDRYKYPYIPSGREGQIYVDESSIKIVEYQDEKKKKPRT